MTKRTYTIDGARFNNLDEFFDEVSAVLVPGRTWGRNLDAFNDLLRGGFGTPDEGFVLVWLNADLSRRRLGHSTTKEYWNERLAKGAVHPANISELEEELRAGDQECGKTLFDELLEIILDHCPGGEEEEDGVELRLK